MCKPGDDCARGTRTEAVTPAERGVVGGAPDEAERSLSRTVRRTGDPDYDFWDHSPLVLLDEEFDEWLPGRSLSELLDILTEDRPEPLRWDGGDAWGHLEDLAYANEARAREAARELFWEACGGFLDERFERQFELIEALRLRYGMSLDSRPGESVLPVLLCMEAYKQLLAHFKTLEGFTSDPENVELEPEGGVDWRQEAEDVLQGPFHPMVTDAELPSIPELNYRYPDLGGIAQFRAFRADLILEHPILPALHQMVRRGLAPSIEFGTSPEQLYEQGRKTVAATLTWLNRGAAGLQTAVRSRKPSSWELFRPTITAFAVCIAEGDKRKQEMLLAFVREELGRDDSWERWVISLGLVVGAGFLALTGVAWFTGSAVLLIGVTLFDLGFGVIEITAMFRVARAESRAEDLASRVSFVDANLAIQIDDSVGEVEILFSVLTLGVSLYLDVDELVEGATGVYRTFSTSKWKHLVFGELPPAHAAEAATAGGEAVKGLAQRTLDTRGVTDSTPTRKLGGAVERQAGEFTDDATEAAALHRFVGGRLGSITELPPHFRQIVDESLGPVLMGQIEKWTRLGYPQVYDLMDRAQRGGYPVWLGLMDEIGAIRVRGGLSKSVAGGKKGPYVGLVEALKLELNEAIKARELSRFTGEAYEAQRIAKDFLKADRRILTRLAQEARGFIFDNNAMGRAAETWLYRAEGPYQGLYRAFVSENMPLFDGMPTDGARRLWKDPQIPELSQSKATSLRGANLSSVDDIVGALAHIPRDSHLRGSAKAASGLWSDFLKRLSANHTGVDDAIYALLKGRRLEDVGQIVDIVADVDDFVSPAMAAEVSRRLTTLIREEFPAFSIEVRVHFTKLYGSSSVAADPQRLAELVALSRRLEEQLAEHARGLIAKTLADSARRGSAVLADQNERAMLEALGMVVPEDEEPLSREAAYPALGMPTD